MKQFSQLIKANCFHGLSQTHHFLLSTINHSRQKKRLAQTSHLLPLAVGRDGAHWGSISSNETLMDENGVLSSRRPDTL